MIVIRATPWPGFRGFRGFKGFKEFRGLWIPLRAMSLYAASRQALRSSLPVIILHRFCSKRKIPLWAGPFLRKGLREAVGIGPKFDVPIRQRLTAPPSPLNPLHLLNTLNPGRPRRPNKKAPSFESAFY